MNAAKQEMFESVRAVVSGRMRDEAQVRDLAHRVSEESTALRRRVERAVAYARAGLRLEACAEAEADPSVFDLAAAFDAEWMQQWRALCARNKLPVQDEVSPESMAEIEEAIAFTAPLRSRLARMRRLVLSDASAWHRLEVLRELVARDPDNPAWQDDRAALEPVTADELGDRVERALAEGDLEDARSCVERLEDGKWHWSGASRVAAQLRTRLDAALAGRAALEAAALADRLEAEWSAENEAGARAALEEWRDLEQRMLSFGGDMPAEPSARVAAAESWLASRDADAAALRENRERVAALERLAALDSATLAQLRSALRAAEQTVEGVPDSVRAAVERRIDAFERSRRMRTAALVCAAVLLLAGAGVGTVLLLRETGESRRIEDMASAVTANVAAGRLDEAERQLAEAERDQVAAADPRIADARKRLAGARGEVADRQRRFALLMAEAGEPADESARPERIEEAKKFVADQAEQDAVAGWIRRHGRAVEERRLARMQEGISLAKDLAAQVASAKPDADASWGGRFGSWEVGLADVERRFGEFPEVVEQVRAGRTALAAQRAKADEARVEQGRLGRLAALGSEAASPERLAAALEAYAAAHPGTEEARSFSEALAARGAWDAVVAWAAASPRPTASLADRPQEERDAAAALLDAHLRSHPASPYAAACTQLKPLLGAAPAWRAWLAEKLASMEALSLWMVERKDGSRWYCRADPRGVAFQPAGGSAWKSVRVVDGRSMKESFQRFDQPQVKSEGPSPQMAFGKQLAKLMEDDEKAVNDLDAAFDAIAVLRDADAVDGALAAALMRGLLESMAPEMPLATRVQMLQAAKRLAREKPDDVDWLNPRDPDARTRSREIRGLMREAVQPDAWRKEYAAAVARPCAALAMLHEPAGVFLRGADGPRVAFRADLQVPAGTALLVADPPVGGKPGAMVRVGSARAGGGADLTAAANSVPPGTMVFMPRNGAAR